MVDINPIWTGLLNAITSTDTSKRKQASSAVESFFKASGNGVDDFTSLFGAEIDSRAEVELAAAKVQERARSSFAQLDAFLKTPEGKILSDLGLV